MGMEIESRAPCHQTTSTILVQCNVRVSERLRRHNCHLFNLFKNLPFIEILAKAGAAEIVPLSPVLIPINARRER